MGNRLLVSCAAAVALCAGSVSAAHAEGFYFGISGGAGTLDVSNGDLDARFLPVVQSVPADGFAVQTYGPSSIDDSDSTWGAYVGYQWNRYFAVEAGYVDLGQGFYETGLTVGDADPDDLIDGGGPFDAAVTAKFRSSGPTLAAVGMLPFGDKFEAHGRVGVLFARTRLGFSLLDSENGDSTVVFGEYSDSSKDLFAGIGASWNINPSYALRVDYERFLDVGDENTEEADVDRITLNILFR